MANRDIEFGIFGDESPFVQALRRAEQAARTGADSISGAFSGLNATFQKINAGFLAVSAALAGGAAFKKAIETTVDLTKESVALGKQFGISATEASILKVALDDTFVSQESLQTAAAKITKTLNTNEGAFKSLGVATRDQNGNFRSTLDIIQDVNARLLQFKEGTDRNVEGVKIYGKSWAEVAPTLKLTQKAMEDAKVKADSLGLTVGQENVEATKRYRSAMNDVHDVISAVLKTVGDALLPILTEAGEWFGSIGPQAVQVMKVAMLGLVGAFQAVKLAVGVAYDFIADFVQRSVVWLLRFADTASHAIRFDFSGAKAAWTTGGEQLDDIAQRTAASIRKRYEDASLAVSDAITRAFTKQTPVEKKDDGLRSDGGAEKRARLVAEWEAELEADKVAYAEKERVAGHFAEYSKQQEVDFWNKKLALGVTNGAEEIAIKTKRDKLLLEIDKATFDGIIGNLKASEAEYSKNAEVRLEIERKAAELIREKYKEDSKEYAAARASVIATERQVQEQLRAIRDLATETQRRRALLEVNAEEQSLKDQYSLRQVNAQQLAALEEGLENRRFQIQQQALAERKAELDPSRDPVAYAQINAELEQLEDQHQARLNEIRRQGNEEAKRDQQTFLGNLQSGFSSSLQALAKGTATLGQTIKSFFATIVGAVIQYFADMVARFIAAAITQRIFGKVTAASTITGHAAEAGSAAFASTAAIPIVGPALAPAAAAAAFSGALAFIGAIPAAAQGYDIPSGLNPITQLHQEEMVLPAKLANAVRAMAESGTTASGGGDTVHIHVTAMDAGSFRDYMEREADSLIPALSKLKRTRSGTFK